MLASAVVAACRPGLLDIRAAAAFAYLDGLHHLTEHTVGKNHRGHTILISLVESSADEVDHLLDGAGSENKNMQIAVAGRSCRLPVIRLRGLDSAESGTAALDVDNDRRKIRTCHIRYTLGLEADSGRGRGSHRADTCGCRTENHIDGGDFALRLKICTAYFRHDL